MEWVDGLVVLYAWISLTRFGAGVELSTKKEKDANTSPESKDLKIGKSFL